MNEVPHPPEENSWGPELNHRLTMKGDYSFTLGSSGSTIGGQSREQGLRGEWGGEKFKIALCIDDSIIRTIVGLRSRMDVQERH